MPPRIAYRADGGRPLISRQGALQRQLDARQWLVWSNLLGAAEQARESTGEDDEGRMAVPQSWQLVRQPAGGVPEVLARGVRSFDLAGTGVVYSRPPSTTRVATARASGSARAHASSR